jgi:hypothetical protein
MLLAAITLRHSTSLRFAPPGKSQYAHSHFHRPRAILRPRKRQDFEVRSWLHRAWQKVFPSSNIKAGPAC